VEDKKWVKFKLDPVLATDPPATLHSEAGEFHLCFDANLVADVEAETGLNLLLPLLGRMTISEFRALLCAFLRASQPLVTLKEAGSLLTRDFDVCSAAINEVFKHVHMGLLQEVPAPAPDEPPTNSEITPTQATSDALRATEGKA
jgi:hypothetical protein